MPRGLKDFKFSSLLTFESMQNQSRSVLKSASSGRLQNCLQNCSFLPPQQLLSLRTSSVLSQCSWKQSRWQMLEGFSERVCDFFFFCSRDRVMILLQSSLRAPAQADLGQTLRAAVTFENDLPLSCKIDNIFVTFPRLTIFCPLCKPVCSYLQTEKDKDVYVCQHIQL